jgi:hypothetical protein
LSLSSSVTSQNKFETGNGPKASGLIIVGVTDSAMEGVASIVVGVDHLSCGGGKKAGNGDVPGV